MHKLWSSINAQVVVIPKAATALVRSVTTVNGLTTTWMQYVLVVTFTNSYMMLYTTMNAVVPSYGD